MPSLGRGRRGDQRVVLNVVIPRNLSDEQRELLEQLRDSITEDNLREPRRRVDRSRKRAPGPAR